MRMIANKKTFRSALVLGLLVSGAVLAQDGTAINAEDLVSERVQVEEKNKTLEQTSLEKSLAEAKAELDDDIMLQKKVNLAKQMHQVRSTREQVDSAVERASLKLPANERKNFVTAMKGILNYNAIEKISIDAMVETYTHKELVSMVEYYSKPEAKSASKKVFYWGGKVQPEVIRMIDKAIMRLRTGQ